MAQTIAHAETREGRTIAVLDCLVSFKPPCSPEEVVKEFAADLKRYGVQLQPGRRLCREMAACAFLNAQCGIEYLLMDKSKSDLYRELLPAINSRARRTPGSSTADLSTVQSGAEGGAGWPGFD